MDSTSWARRATDDGQARSFPSSTSSTEDAGATGVIELPSTAPGPEALPELLDRLPDEGASADHVELGLSAFLETAVSALRGRSPEERNAFRDDVLTRLRPISDGSPLLRAVRGRREVGTRSFEALNQTFRNQPAGDHPAATGFERFLLGSSPLSALRARRIFIAREMMYQFRYHTDRERPFSILGLGGGPDAEAFQLLRALHESGPPVQVTLVDGDREALKAARDIADAEGFGAAVRCIHGDPVRLALGSHVAIAPQDFIYSAGLVEYLPDPLAVRLLDFSFQRLRRGGELLFAHYHDRLTDVDQLVMEWWLQWFPYFRVPQQIAKLIRETSIPASGRLAGLARGPNYYVVIQRAK